jgi:hypothetical protein
MPLRTVSEEKEPPGAVTPTAGIRSWRPNGEVEEEGVVAVAAADEDDVAVGLAEIM